MANGALSGQLLDYATTLRDHEIAHVEFLQGALGDAAIERPSFDFGTTVTDPEEFIFTSISLEDTAIAAYNGQAARLRRRTLATAASIVSVEARHAAWALRIAREDRSLPAHRHRRRDREFLPAREAFDPLASAADVREFVGPEFIQT